MYASLYGHCGLTPLRAQRSGTCELIEANVQRTSPILFAATLFTLVHSHLPYMEAIIQGLWLKLTVPKHTEVGCSLPHFGRLICSWYDIIRIPLRQAPSTPLIRPFLAFCARRSWLARLEVTRVKWFEQAMLCSIMHAQ